MEVMQNTVSISRFLRCQALPRCCSFTAAASPMVISRTKTTVTYVQHFPPLVSHARTSTTDLRRRTDGPHRRRTWQWRQRGYAPTSQLEVVIQPSYSSSDTALVQRSLHWSQQTNATLH